jgi:hypothetical protein
MDTTEGDHSKHTWLASSVGNSICHSVYTQVLRYVLPVSPKTRDRPNIPARGIAAEREPATEDILKERKDTRDRNYRQHLQEEEL